jgi:Fur family ferric uptake transcriptional regulator
MENLIDSLKSSGAKLTRPRKIVLKSLIKINRPSTLKEIHQESDSIDFASVYRTIKLFCSIGIVNEIYLGEKQARYEVNNDKHHHHIFCEECGKIQKLDMCILNKVEKISNYKISNHSIEFIGLCPDCQ